MKRRWFLSPVSAEAALCVWDTAGTTVVTQLPALGWGLQHSFLLVMGTVLVFNVKLGSF